MAFLLLAILPLLHDPPFASYPNRHSSFTYVDIIVLYGVSMPGDFEGLETSASTTLPFYRTDVMEMVEGAETWRLQDGRGLRQEELRYV